MKKKEVDPIEQIAKQMNKGASLRNKELSDLRKYLVELMKSGGFSISIHGPGNMNLEIVTNTESLPRVHKIIADYLRISMEAESGYKKTKSKDTTGYA